MGCVFSRQDYEADPRIFHVWNVDSDGRPLKPGKIEVTDTQLILYQKENIVVRWPLISLRRYGFDSEVFSFECGRRCTTGAGIYAFKCRRAQALFAILQECINNSGAAPSSLDEQVALLPSVGDRMPSLPNGVIHTAGHSSPTEDSAGYLEPITAGSHLHYPAPPPRNNNGTTSPGGYVCIHSTSGDWPGIPSSLPSCCSLGNFGKSPHSSSHHYENNGVVLEQGGNCPNCMVNQYVNSSVVVSSSELSRHCCPHQCCSPDQTYVNSAIVTLSPSQLPCCASHCVDYNTNYAKLNDLLKQEQQSAKRHKEQHFYVNVKPDVVANSGSSASSKCVSGRSTPTEVQVSSTPTSPGSGKGRCYANPESSQEQAQVNYAVLDLDQTEACNAAGIVAAATSVSAPNSMHSLVSSPVHSPEGYAQIDFDKTVALSISAIPCPAFNDDSIRKTRHNAVIPCASMSA